MTFRELQDFVENKMRMKKYLYIVLLVGFGFGQSIDSEKHLKVLYPINDSLNKKLKKLIVSFFNHTFF